MSSDPQAGSPIYENSNASPIDSTERESSEEPRCFDSPNAEAAADAAAPRPVESDAPLQPNESEPTALNGGNGGDESCPAATMPGAEPPIVLVDPAAAASVAPAARPRMGVGRLIYLTIRCVVLAALAGVLLGAAWLKFTPEGQATWHDIAPAFLPAMLAPGGGTSNERELEIGARLQEAGVLVVWVGQGDQKRISSVDFQHCHPDAEMLKQLVELQHLSSVSLALCPLDTAELIQIGRLDQIVSLALGGTKINDEGLKHLGRMRRLTALFLTDTPVSDAGLPELTGLRDLRILDLSRTRVTDAGMATIARCPRLEHLLISETAVTDAGLDQLHGAKSLRRVTLLGTKTTRQGHDRLKAAFTEIMMTIDF